METSSADTGSSQTMKSGESAKGPGDADALTLAAGEFVGIARCIGRIEAHPLEQGGHHLVALAAARDAMHLDRLADDAPHAHARIQAGDGILKNDLHVPPQPAEFFAAVGEEVHPFVANIAAGGGDEPQDRAADGGLAAARFANEAERLAGLDIEADAIDCLDVPHRAREHPAANREVRPQVLAPLVTSRPSAV